MHHTWFDCVALVYRVKHVRSAGEALGLNFSTSRQRSPNTLKAHALLEFAKEVDSGDKQDMVSDRLFKVQIYSSTRLILRGRDPDKVHILISV